MFNAERSEQMHTYNADFFAFVVEIFSSLLTAGADSNNNSVRVRCAVVVKNVVFATCNFCNFCHRILNNVRQFVIIVVDSFANLEIDIGICRSAANDRVVRI